MGIRYSRMEYPSCAGRSSGQATARHGNSEARLTRARPPLRSMRRPGARSIAPGIQVGPADVGAWAHQVIRGTGLRPIRRRTPQLARSQASATMHEGAMATPRPFSTAGISTEKPSYSGAVAAGPGQEGAMSAFHSSHP